MSTCTRSSSSRFFDPTVNASRLSGWKTCESLEKKNPPDLNPVSKLTYAKLSSVTSQSSAARQVHSENDSVSSLSMPNASVNVPSAPGPGGTGVTCATGKRSASGQLATGTGGHTRTKLSNVPRRNFSSSV